MSTHRCTLTGVLVFLLGWGLQAQTVPPLMVWQKSMGGMSNDFLVVSREMPDGGSVLGGYSDSPPSGSKAAPAYGRADYWMIRLNASGEKVWDQSYGGDQDDVVVDLELTGDGGFLVGGYSLSGSTGNKTASSLGKRDYWVLRFDADGALLWQKAYGSAEGDTLQDVVPVAGGGFLLCGYSFFSVTNEFKTSPSYGQVDYWIVRIDGNGNRLWDQTYGGAGSDTLARGVATASGGFVLAGYSTSGPDGTKTTPWLGGNDGWLVLVDPDGVQVSEHVFGGTGNDYLLNIIPAAGGDFYLGGTSASLPGTYKSAERLGEDDFWLVRVNQNGQRLWDHSYGGTASEVMWSLAMVGDDRVVMAGWSESMNDGTKVSESFGNADFWVVGVDTNGMVDWDQSYGGAGVEVAYAVLSASDDSLLLAGYSASGANGCKLTDSLGGNDGWLLRITEVGVPPLVAPNLSAPWQTSAQIALQGFHLTLHGQTSRCYTLEHSGNLQTWQPFATNFLVAPQLELTDPDANPIQPRFYRARLRP